MREVSSPGRIPVAGPWITRREVDYVTDAVKNAWYRDANIYHERFEAALAAHVGRKYAMALPSCTSALHLILAGLDLRPGDEVLVPDATWIATSAPIHYVGATPIFVDVDMDTWCMSADAMEAAISPRTRAAIVVDLYGGMPDMDALQTVANRRGVVLIEDAAEAFGSEYRGRRAGSFGIASAFSFHGSKTITTGEGGMLVTDDRRLFERAAILRDHGRQPGDVFFFNGEVAFKYKMSAMQAALGLAQIERAEEIVNRKRLIFDWYLEALRGYPEITLNAEPPGVLNSYWMVTALWPAGSGRTMREVADSMRAAGVDTRPFFHPLSSIPAYAGTASAEQARRRNHVSYDVSSRGINLPSGFNMTPDLVERVVRAFLSGIGVL